MADPLLNHEIKRRVQDIYADFVSDVNPIRLSDRLIQEKVITIDQWEEIRGSVKTNPDICRKLLNHLLSLSNPKTFVVVREALVKENHWLLQNIDQLACTCKQAEKFAELEKNNQKLQSQIKELKDEFEKAKNDMEEERRAWIVREQDLTNTKNSEKEESVQLKKDWLAKDQKDIATITQLGENVTTNKNELSLKRKVSPSSLAENDESVQIKRANIIPTDPGVSNAMQIPAGVKQDTDSKNPDQELIISSVDDCNYDNEYSSSYDDNSDSYGENNNDFDDFNNDPDELCDDYSDDCEDYPDESFDNYSDEEYSGNEY